MQFALAGCGLHRLTLSPAAMETPDLLRKLVTEHPKKLKPLCEAADLPYFRMRDFMAGVGPGLRFEQMDRLSVFLTGKSLRPCSGRKGVA
jgi:hypothetical protein